MNTYQRYCTEIVVYVVQQPTGALFQGRQGESVRLLLTLAPF